MSDKFMKKDTVIGTLYGLDKNNTFPTKQMGKKRSCMQYHLSYINKVNKDYFSRKEVIVIDWEKSIENHDKDWFDYIFPLIETNVLKYRREVTGNIDEGYSEMVDKNIIDNPDYYLVFLENQLYDLLRFKGEKTTNTNSELDDLKAKAKELGITLKGRQTAEGIQAKINEFELGQ